MEKKGTSWGWIVFWLIIFWPVGLALLVNKLANDKSALMSGKTGIISAVGWFFIIFGILGIVAAFDTSSSDAVLGIIIGPAMIIGGILVLRKVSKTKRTAARYKKYIELAVNQNVRGIDNIAASIGLPYELVVRNLQDMINIGYLKDAYIDREARELVFKQIEPISYTQESTHQRADVQKIAVRCPGCGANNVVSVGSVSECDYCGTPVSA
ncbi:hypothetical protein Ami103574_10305 [Aminipila butyrica]|uniref:Uncharacterized protein n=1 Tax=Aminipila butyrica TaxID=433296 RepID=A0A858BWY6_9FIRM|nr:hypothetical protein [Aminipila butyrica]QIB69689.1 hypothetical protein Ami103574_10305 [Aminipila butyrica]